MKNTKLTSCFALVMLITGAIDSIRNLPATALFGPTLLFFCVLAAIFFLIPVAMVSAQLSREFPEIGGIYEWVKSSLGEKTAVVGIWLQWINTLVWYPTILVFIASTFAHLIDPALDANKLYLVTMIVGVFWVMSFINLFGVRFSGNIATFCATAGVFVPLAALIFFAIYWIATGHLSQFDFHDHWLPQSWNLHHMVALTAIITSFLGVELACVHHKDIDHAERMFPTALFFSVILIVGTMIIGSLAIAAVLPHDNISLTDGVMQAFANFAKILHLPHLPYLMSILIVVGSLGGMINWIISPSKGLLQAARDGYLPKALAVQNKYHVPFIIVFLQACAVTVIAFSYVLIPDLSSAYWLLTDLSTELYVMMYVIFLIAAIVLNSRKYRHRSTYIWCGMGLVGCVCALLVGFLPPEQIPYHVNYQMLFGVSLVAMVLPALALLGYKKKSNS